MSSTAATSSVMPPWVVLLQAFAPILLLLLYKSAQYLIEGQRHRNARQIADKIRPGVKVRIEDHASLLAIQHETPGAAATEAAVPSPEDEKPPPTNVVPFPTYSAADQTSRNTNPSRRSRPREP